MPSDHSTRRPESAIGQNSAATLIGWREWLALPGLGIPAIKAKIDSGARSSALHVDALVEEQRSDGDWVRFQIQPRRRSRTPRSGIWFEARIHARRPVTDSGGHVSQRPFIRTLVRIGEQTFETEINLTNRRGMLFPMLLGRTAMAGRFVVDPAASYLLPKPSTHRKRPRA
ncbi:MAG: ATP-dependent zinc protease [Lysobacterales bacterium]